MQESRRLTIREPRPLTTDEIRFFRYNGFLKLLKLPWQLPSELVEAIKQQAADDIEQAVEPLFRDYRGDVMRVSAIWERGGAIREALGGPEVVPALQSQVIPDSHLLPNEAPGLKAENDPWWIESGLLEQRISRRRVGPQARGGLRRTRVPGQRRQAACVDQAALTHLTLSVHARV